MLTFRVRTFTVLIGFLVFTLAYVTIGIRWHTNRARASLYARQELEHTFQAAKYSMAARNIAPSADSSDRALQYRKLARIHEKAARESTRLREIYESALVTGPIASDFEGIPGVASGTPGLREAPERL